MDTTRTTGIISRQHEGLTAQGQLLCLMGAYQPLLNHTKFSKIAFRDRLQATGTRFPIRQFEFEIPTCQAS